MKRLVGALVGAVTLLGCGPQPKPDFVTKLGVQVFLQGHAGYAPSTVDDAEQYLMDGLKATDKTLKCMKSVEVYIFDKEEMFARDPKTKPAGLEYGNVLHLADFGGCVDNTAWIHEEAHWIQDCERNVYDPNHTLEPEVWTVVNSRPNRCEK